MERRRGPLALLVGLLAGLSCTPYAPPCRTGSARTLVETQGWLVPHAGGRVSWLEQRTTRTADGGSQQTAVVSRFTAEGDPEQPPQALELRPAGSLFGSLTRSLVDFPDGVAVSERLRDPDGGSSVLVSLHRADGSLSALELPKGSEPSFSVPRLTQAGEALQVDPGGDTLHAVSFAGELIATRPLEGAQVAQGGADALVLIPGPVLLSPELATLTTAPEPPVAGGAAGWDLGAGRIAVGSASDTDVLLDLLESSGTRRPTVRVSSGTNVLSVAVAEHGTGLVFSAPSPAAAESSATSLELWFAFLDQDGRKRGPDLHVPIPLETLGAVASWAQLVPSGQGFTLFVSSLEGLRLVPVRCEPEPP